ncbi:hypothetical protein, partial [Paenacidovorax caeni]|uniref:hypothetical protein n=1 Tax=Paenacidovorax caeni TaxID=343013 RepID=UPI001F2195EF
QRIAHLVSLVLARGLGEQIELQGAAGRDHGKGRVRLLGSGRERMGFEKFPEVDHAHPRLEGRADPLYHSVRRPHLRQLKSEPFTQKFGHARLETDKGLIVGIGIDGAFSDHSRCVAEAWEGTLIVGWRKAYANQDFANDALRVEMAQKLAGKSDRWWLCWTTFGGPAREIGSAVAGSAEGLLFLHEDNRDPKHPTALHLAQELWNFFEPFQERMSESYRSSDDASSNG